MIVLDQNEALQRVATVASSSRGSGEKSTLANPC